LRLHPDESLHRVEWLEPLAVEQELPREERAVQLAQRERAVRDGGGVSDAAESPAVASPS